MRGKRFLPGAEAELSVRTPAGETILDDIGNDLFADRGLFAVMFRPENPKRREGKEQGVPYDKKRPASSRQGVIDSVIEAGLEPTTG